MRAARAPGRRFSSENERTASSTVAIDETCIGSPFANAPAPRSAHQRASRAGAETTPTCTTTAVLSSAIERRPHRDAARVVPRPVDRVDDPATRARADHAVLFAEDRVVRALLGEYAAQFDLDGAVGLGDRRQVRLRLDRQPGAKVRQRDRVGRVGESKRELEVGAHGADPTALPARDTGTSGGRP